MKTRVVITIASMYGDYKPGEQGFIEGFVRDGGDRPCAVLSMEDGQFVLVPVIGIKIL